LPLIFLQEASSAGRDFGKNILDNILRLIRETYGGLDHSTKRECLIGTTEFVKRFGTVHFIDPFSKIKYIQRYEVA
jgi:hypothetical protein